MEKFIYNLNVIMNMKNLNNKIVLITGASSGIGAETAKEFAKLGTTVLLLARTESNLKKVANEIIENGGKAKIYPCDVGKYEQVKVVTDKIKHEVGIPDVIFNNAGGGKWRFVEETEYEEAVEMISAPYLGAFFITKAFMPEMLKKKSGHIVNMSTFAAIMPFAGATGYIAARKAMIGFHEALTYDLHQTNIKTSLSYFAEVDSPFWEHNPGSRERLPGVGQKLIPVITDKQAAKVIVKGILKNKKIITAPFMIKVVEFMKFINPIGTRWLLRKTGYKRRKKKV